MRVLAVDDHEAVRGLVVEALVDNGMEALEAASGVDALHCLTVTPAIVVVSTDIRMPGGASGWELARRFRAAWPDIGVVYTSGCVEGTPELVPGSVFLDQPVRIAHLVQAIDAAARKSG